MKRRKRNGRKTKAYWVDKKKEYIKIYGKLIKFRFLLKHFRRIEYRLEKLEIELDMKEERKSKIKRYVKNIKRGHLKRCNQLF